MQELRLVADVGGTNTRIACFDASSARLHSLREYRNHQYASFAQVLEAWFAETNGIRPSAACIAVAAPPNGDDARMSNINWHLRGTELAQRFGFQQVRLLNDFQANACALPWLGSADCCTLQQGKTARPDRLAVLGPGTGLGGAVLEQRTHPPAMVACEPSQMDLAPHGALQLALWGVLQQQHPRLYAELLLSGPGLRRLYLALGVLEDRATEGLSPAEISARALAGSDPLCATTLAVFCALLGAASANFVLANGAFEALYLAGGILPKVLPLLAQSDFLARFHAHGPMREHLQGTAIAVITYPHPGLLGAARATLG